MAFGNPPSGPPPGYGGPPPGPGSYPPPPGYPQQQPYGGAPAAPGYPPQQQPYGGQPGAPGYPQQQPYGQAPGFPGPGYGVQPPVPRPPRPATVTMAVFLQFGLVVLALVNIVMSFVVQAAIKSATQEALDKLNASVGGTSQPTDLGGSTSAAIVGGACVGLVMITIFTLLAIFNARGSNMARIFSWIVSGLALCWGAVATVGSVALYTAASKSLESAGLGALPGWIMAYQYGLIAILVLVHGAIVVLLALPASNAYFNPRVR